MKGTLAGGFAFPHILSKTFRDADDSPEGVSKVINETMEPIVSAHVEAIVTIGAFLRLYFMRHPELHLDIQKMPFEAFDEDDKH